MIRQSPLEGFPDSRSLVGLRHGAPAGPARLLGVLVLRGLSPDRYLAAAALVLELDGEAVERTSTEGLTDR